MSSRAPNLRPSKAARAAKNGFPGVNESILAEQLAWLVVTNPSALDLLASALDDYRSISCKPCSGCAIAPPPAITKVETSVEGGDALIPLEAVKQIAGLGKTRIYELVRQRKFPAPYKPGGTSTRWSLAEVQAWRHGLKSTR